MTFWCGALKTSALSASEVHAAETMKSVSSAGAVLAETLKVADEIGELDHLIALVMMAEDHRRLPSAALQR
jgi:hypothetical protein